MRALAILCVRNEGAFLLDWLAHHRAVGFTDFLVFSNDCSDGTDLMLDHLAGMGVLRHIPNPGPYHQRGIQFTALNRAAQMGPDADWILPLDIDEFVNIHVGDGTLPALLNALPDATAITLTWRLFGNDGQVHYIDEPVPQRFTRAAPLDLAWPWRAAMFKTLYRNTGAYEKPGIHRPRAPKNLNDQRWFDGEGRALPEKFHRQGVFSHFGRSNHALVQLNHYPLGAMESFVLKSDRGRAVHADQVLGMDYWVERNWNTDEDLTIQRYANASAAQKAGWLADPELARLHQNAVNWRHARFAELMQQEAYRALFGRLLMTPPSTPLGRDPAQVLHAHAHAAHRKTASRPG